MEQSIRKIFHQVKKTHKTDKTIEGFKDFWSELTTEDKVNVYCKWADLLKKALIEEKNPESKHEKESITMQDQIFVRKNFFNKWEKRIVKLTPTHFNIIGNKKNKEFPLKNYGLRRSKNKENYSFVLQPVNLNGKVVHCGVSNKIMFDEWFYGLSCNIENERIFYFLNVIRQSRISSKYDLKLNSNETGKTKIEENPKTLT